MQMFTLCLYIDMLAHPRIKSQEFPSLRLCRPSIVIEVWQHQTDWLRLGISIIIFTFCTTDSATKYNVEKSWPYYCIQSCQFPTDFLCYFCALLP